MRNSLIAISLALFTTSLFGCASNSHHENSSLLIEGGNGLDNFNRVGEANWQATETDIQANKSNSTYAYLVTKSPYKNFHLTVEFWASDDANSGVFFRCLEPQNITAENCYEANIFDQRPDPSYGTGGIVLIAKSPTPMPKAGGKWNTYEITANGSHLTLVLNGVTTVDIEDSKLAEGYFALQWGSGTIKFRRVEIQLL
jgi:Domain of Unknown Function (DUF1080)